MFKNLPISPGCLAMVCLVFILLPRQGQAQVVPAAVPGAPLPTPKVPHPSVLSPTPPPARDAVVSPLLPPSIHGGGKAARVAITEFKVEGENASPTLSMQLQDGFVVGLTRTAPIYVLDTVDVARYMDAFPELQKCEGSICVKRFGQLLDVSHLIRVSVVVTGNSYTLTGRLFSTEDPSPAAVPVATEARFCNVCTVDDVRQKMVQLGNEIKRPIVSWLDAWRPPPAPPPAPKSWRRPLATLGVAAGFATLVGGGALFANSAKDGPRLRPAIAGALCGLGASMVAVGTYLIVTLPTDGQKNVAVAVSQPF